MSAPALIADTVPQINFPASEPDIAANRQRYYDAWREAGPVVWTQGRQRMGGWLVLSHAEAREIVRSDDRFSKELFRAADMYPGMLPPDTVEWMQLLRNDMFFRDDPDHKRLRGLVVPSLDRHAVERMRAATHALCDRLIPRLLERESFDLVCDFAWPVSALVLSELIGFEPEDAWRFPAWALDRRHFSPLLSSPEMLSHITVSVKETDSFIGRMIHWRRKDARDDMISRMTAMIDDGYPANETEVTVALRIMGLAGFETTRDLIAGGILALTEHPDEYAKAARAGALPPTGVDELLRYVTPDQNAGRIATRDSEVGGHAVRAGDQVFAILGAANRDPEVFEDPHELRLHRANAGDHLAFSGGIHFCVGALIARAVAGEAVARLAAAMPGLRIDRDNIRYTSSFQANSLRQLGARVA